MTRAGAAAANAGIDYGALAAAAALCINSYAAAPVGFVIDMGPNRAVITEAADGSVDVTWRGTIDLANWRTDLDAVPRDQPPLGLCHAGILAVAEAMAPVIAPHVRQRVWRACGHSLGGGDAILSAAIFKAMDSPPAQVTAIEPPRVGMDALASYLADVPGVITRFGDDPVPEVPLWPYRHPWEPLAIGHSMPDPIDCHLIGTIHIWLVAQARGETAQ